MSFNIFLISLAALLEASMWGGDFVRLVIILNLFLEEASLLLHLELCDAIVGSCFYLVCDFFPCILFRCGMFFEMFSNWLQ